MTTLKEIMQDRMNSRPDRHTLAWWQNQFEAVAKGYRGLTHAVNCVLAEIEDRDAKVKELMKRCDENAGALMEANAKIGKLQTEITELQESMEKAREAYAELKKNQLL